MSRGLGDVYKRQPLVKVKSVDKPLSIAIEELYESKIKIISEDNNDEE